MKATAQAYARRRNLANRLGSGDSTTSAPATGANTTADPPSPSNRKPEANEGTSLVPSSQIFNRVVHVKKGGPSGGLGFMIEVID